MGAEKKDERWGNVMTKLIYKYAGFLATLAVMITTMAVNTTCTWLTYQPTLPENARKLRKI